jgi:peptide chain release factor subunit 1
MITAEHVRHVLELDGAGLPVVSLYVRVPLPPDDKELRARVNSLLSEVRALAADQSVERDVRLSVRSDIQRIEDHVAQWRVGRPGMLVFFCCSGRDIFEVVELSRPVRGRLVLDATPWVRGMLAVLAEYHRMCVVVVERGAATLWELYQEELRALDRRRTPAAVPPRRVPALEEHQAHHRAEDVTRRHFRSVIEEVDELFRADGFDLLAVGGHEHEVPEFLDLLPRQLRGRVAGTFPVDPHTPGIAATIRDRAGAILDDYEAQEQRRRVTEVVETTAAGGPAALGVADCAWATALAAVDTLLVLEGAVVPGVLCDHCGWIGDQGRACPRCGHPLRPTTDILDELVERVIDEGGSVKHVTVPTELSEHLAGARLRFALPPPP